MELPTQNMRTLASYGFKPSSNASQAGAEGEQDAGHQSDIEEILQPDARGTTNDMQEVDLRPLLFRGVTQENCSELSKITFDTLKARLECFHLDRDRLLGQMEVSNAYISGSFPLTITHPHIQPKDLDMYVRFMDVGGLVDFLVREGYGQPIELGTEYKDETGGTGTEIRNTYNGIVRVLSLKHDKGEVVNIVATEGPPIQVIPLFHSTVVMNYIASHGFVMMYPKTTLDNMGMINCGGKLPRKIIGCVSKYRERGFVLVRDFPSMGPNSHRCGTDKYCPQTIRHLQDKAILHVPFPAYVEEDLGRLRQEKDAEKCVWQLANGPFCKQPTADKHGFSLVNTYASMKTKTTN
ncbi:hypothetical protein EST38_g9675 [Candolleomyces aberdarensis]|uniref:Uncharacterized protein n=1 Tax=Candolleomyces aberdarensis TaxID=2316362 RepID=A0A4Q2DC81_9AGAR|nr:hypothetical protein EST38_g9675 [Candolleomyces aberdarensis]